MECLLVLGVGMGEGGTQLGLFVFFFMHVIRWAFYFMSSGLCRVLSTHVGVTRTPLRGDWI